MGRNSRVRRVNRLTLLMPLVLAAGLAGPARGQPAPPRAEQAVILVCVDNDSGRGAGEDCQWMHFSAAERGRFDGLDPSASAGHAAAVSPLTVIEPAPGPVAMPELVETIPAVIPEAIRTPLAWAGHFAVVPDQSFKWREYDTDRLEFEQNLSIGLVNVNDRARLRAARFKMPGFRIRLEY